MIILSFSKYTGEIAVKYYFFYYLNQGTVVLNSTEIFCVKSFAIYLLLIFLLNVSSFCNLYLLLGSLYLFLSFLSLRSMFLLLGIVTRLSVRVPRGSFGYLSQVFDRKKGVQSAENCKRQRIPNGIVPSSSWVRKSEIFQSDLTSHQGLKLTELLSQVGVLKNIS